MRSARTALVLALTVAVSAAAPRSQSDELAELELEYLEARDEYLDLLGEALPGAYRERLADLSRQELETVARVRRLWHWYIEEGPFTMGDPRRQRTGIFRQEFLDPMEEVAELLLIDPERIGDADVRRARADAVKAARRWDGARRRADVDIDPTVEKTAPTGIAYPRLDEPHTAEDLIGLYERTLVLARTVAPDEAEEVLWENAEACAEIDRLEADFVMYANTMRMLSGSIAWVCDPLMTACTRDHSHDRANGDASGHQSKLEGKRFPRDRARRFGCRVGPEGAGGGHDGRSAIRGLAYNGTGHGGPLFAMLRNVVAPGRRGGALTAMYQTDGRLKHACQATEGELVLPPGVSARDLESGSLRSAFRALAASRIAKAESLLDGRAPKDDFQKAIHHFLEARVEAEVEWTLDGIEHILDAGDAYEAKRRFDDAERRMDGIRSFDVRARRIAARLSQRAVRAEIEVGQRYQQLIGERGGDERRLQQFVEAYPDSAYAGAARHLLESGGKGFWPELFFFVMRDPHLNKWSYLTKERVGER